MPTERKTRPPLDVATPLARADRGSRAFEAQEPKTLTGAPETGTGAPYLLPTERGPAAEQDQSRLHARRLRVLEGIPPRTLLIHEIYASIQGESTYAGRPCTFVRLTGCPLRCWWCDTPHAFHEGRVMSLEDILAAVDALTPRLVELTGGEPLAQPLALDLMTALAQTGRTVLLETSGALPIDAVDPRVIVILDVKCPSSGEAGSNRYENLRRLKPADEVKFVIGDRQDFDWSLRVIDDYGLERHPLLFAPVFGHLPEATLCAWIVESGRQVRFQPQIHKYVWPPDTRGV